MLETDGECKPLEMKIRRFNDENDEAPLSTGRALLPIPIVNGGKWSLSPNFCYFILEFSNLYFLFIKLLKILI